MEIFQALVLRRAIEGLSGFPEVASLIACARAVISVKDAATNDTGPVRACSGVSVFSF